MILPGRWSPGGPTRVCNALYAPWERPNRVRACWLCSEKDHLAAACPEMLEELQDKLGSKGIQFTKAVRWEDRQAKGASPGRRYPKTVHSLPFAILHSIQENLYEVSPAD